MSQKKTALVVGLVALTVFGAPMAASAAPVHTDFPNVSFHTEDGEDGSDDSFDDGDSDKDDHHKSIPPVFVVPGEKHHRDHKAGTTPSTTPDDGSDDGSTTLDDSNTVDGATVDPAAASDFVVMGPGDAPVTDQLGGVNPEEARAIDIKKVMVTHKSPADEFVDAAYIGLGLLGASAVGLGATAGIRAIRLRRSGKTDYLYGEK